MRKFLISSLGAVFLGLAPLTGFAASLQVAPVIVDVSAPSKTGSITLRNTGPRSINAQVRVFKWVQKDGVERLERTRDVVASPPIVRLSSRKNYKIRVVRMNKKPVKKEESYRLIVDELPDPGRAKNGAILVVLRHSIPVFFSPIEAKGPKIAWSASVKKGKLILNAKNRGGRRLRLANMSVHNGAKLLPFGDGLVGYSLAGATMKWERPLPKGYKVSSLKINADTDRGPLKAKAK